MIKLPQSGWVCDVGTNAKRPKPPILVNPAHVVSVYSPDNWYTSCDVCVLTVAGVIYTGSYATPDEAEAARAAIALRVQAAQGLA